MYRHHFPARIRYEGDPTLAAPYVGEARGLLGLLMGELGEANIRSGKRFRRLPGVVEIEASFDGTEPAVTIRVPPAINGGVIVDVDLWAPRGFITYPASDASADGWGAPVLPSDAIGVGPYDPPNLAPGVDPERWTDHGALGQVLLSKDKDAGYPKRPASLVPPMYFRIDYGLKPLKAFELRNDATDTWAAYRMEFVDFTAQSPDAPIGEQTFINLQKRLAFEAVNDHRFDAGRDPLLLPIRGYYDSAQASAEIMFATHTLGHYAGTFPETYATYPDRIEKDGFTSYVDPDESNSRNEPSGGGGENAAANAVSSTIIGVDPNGSNIYDFVPGSDISAAEAYAAWIASPEHLANIESTVYDKAFTSTFLGFKHPVAVQEFVHRTQWIQCGNRQWISSEPEIPILSFFGFASVNLCWETWPATFNNTDPAIPPVDPLTMLTDLRDASDELFWLRYRYADEAANNNEFDYRNAGVPALDGRIFCRGRAIGVVPNGGWVWAAAVRKYEATTLTPATYRLIALVHHEDDQPSNQKINGMTRYLRVWWCDIPLESGIPFNPQSTIRGVYGDEDEGFPWDVVNSPYSWRGGELVDVATESTQNHLKYASQWTFNAAATKAVCLRDFGEYDDYVDLYRSASEVSVFVTNGTYARALELELVASAAGDDIVPDLTFFAQPDGVTPQNIDVGDASGDWLVVTAPIAAGYDADDNLSYCHVTYLLNPFNVSPNTPSTYYSAFSFNGNYHYAPGTYAVGTRFSCAVAREDTDRLPYVFMPSVLDVKDQAVACFGVVQFFEFNGTFTTANSEFACWYNNAADTVAKVLVYRGGDLLSERGFSNPDGTVFSLFAFCYQTAPAPTPAAYWIGTQLELSQNAVMVPSYARTREDWLASYIVQPQESTRYRVTSPSSDCEVYVDLDWSCVPTPGSALTTLLEGDAECRGGWMQASFADEDSLISMLRIPGEKPRTLYARAV